MAQTFEPIIWTFVHCYWDLTEGGVRVCGIAVLGYFWCGVAVIFISKYGIAVFRVQAVCGEFEFYVAVVGEKIVVSRWSAGLVSPGSLANLCDLPVFL